MTKIKKGLQGVIITLLVVVFSNAAHSQTNDPSKSKNLTIKCASEDKPYRDFDFVIGNW